MLSEESCQGLKIATWKGVEVVEQAEQSSAVATITVPLRAVEMQDPAIDSR
jgi:hypothetical protein